MIPLAPIISITIVPMSLVCLLSLLFIHFEVQTPLQQSSYPCKDANSFSTAVLSLPFSPAASGYISGFVHCVWL